MGEIWSLVDINGIETGVCIERGTNTPIPKGMYHTAVNIWTRNDEGRILLTKRHPEIVWGLRWECSGGGLVKGEEPGVGAQRELMEETGISLPLTAFTSLGVTVLEKKQCLLHNFFVRVNSDVKIKLQAEEVVDYRWVNENELEAMQDELVPGLWERWLRFKDTILL